MPPPMTTARTQLHADGTLEVVDGDGVAWFFVDVVDGHSASFGVYAGAASGAMFDAAIHLSQQAVTSSPTAVTFFCDALYVHRYDSAFRERWVKWFLAHRRRVDIMHFAIPQQGLLRMGLQLVGMAVPGFVHTLDDDAGLDAVLGVHAPAFRRLRARRDAWRAHHKR